MALLASCVGISKGERMSGEVVQNCGFAGKNCSSWVTTGRELFLINLMTLHLEDRNHLLTDVRSSDLEVPIFNRVHPHRTESGKI